jgi:parallel beta-helix repeat protein
MTIAFSPATLAAPGKITNCPKTITQPGLYELQDNLDAVGSCIIVQADFVTINLNGFRIRGNGTGSAIVEASVYRGTSVRNGTVTNFENAISIGTDATVDEVKSFDNTNVGILVRQGVVRNSQAQGNLNNHGISVGGRSLVTGNISRNNRSGISATHGSNIRGNTVSDNAVGGILTQGTGIVIADNAVFNNTSFGIGADCPSLVLGNTTLFHSLNLMLNGAGCRDEHNVAQ